jgi:hypothetical protein
MILLDNVIQVFARPDLRLKTQQSILLQFSNSDVGGGVAVERDPLRCAVLIDCPSEVSFSGSNIPVLAEQEIDRVSVLIDGTVEVTPSPSDSDVSLVHAPRGADGPCVTAPAFFELRHEALNESAG